MIEGKPCSDQRNIPCSIRLAQLVKISDRFSSLGSGNEEDATSGQGMWADANVLKAASERNLGCSQLACDASSSDRVALMFSRLVFGMFP